MDQLIAALTGTQWAMYLPVLHQMKDLVLRHARGERLAEDEIAAIVAKRGGRDGEDELYVTAGGVAIVPITGVIFKGAGAVKRISGPSGTSTGEIQTGINRALNDPDVRGIVLEVDSPGGSVAGVEATANFIRKAGKRKPVVTFAADMTASAAYWMGAQAGRLVVNATGEVGSIGVYMVVPDSSEMYDKLGIAVHVIGTGEFKGAGTWGAEVTEEQLGDFHRVVEDINAVFVRQVAAGRNMNVKDVRTLADGRVFVGADAVAKGLADQVGGLEDAIRLAGRLADERGVGTQPGAGSTQPGAAGLQGGTPLHGGTQPGAAGLQGGALGNGTLEPAWSAEHEREYCGSGVSGGGSGDEETAAETILDSDKDMGATGMKPKTAANVPQTADADVGGGVGDERVTQAAGATGGGAGGSQPGAAGLHGGVDVERLTRDTLAAERTRVRHIRNMAAQVGLDAQWADGQIEADASIAEANAAALEALHKTHKSADICVGEDLNHSSIAPAMVDAICKRAGTTLEDPAVALAGEGSAAIEQAKRARERSREFGGLLLSGFAAEFLTLHGEPTRGAVRPQVCRAVFNYPGSPRPLAAAGSFSHSASDFPLILEAAVGKRLMQGFNRARSSWDTPGLMHRVTKPDFKDIKILKFGDMANLLEVKEGEEYVEGTFAEGREVYRLLKYGRTFYITWETLVNDDMDVFAKIPQMMGNAAKRLENVVAWAPLVGAVNGEVMADGKAIFHADHKNWVDTGTALSVDAISEMLKLMRLQEGLPNPGDGTAVNIDIDARFLVVPVNLEAKALELMKSTVRPGETNAVPNIYQSRFTVVSDPLIDKIATTGSTGWYLAADANEHETIEVAFLEGEEQPMIERLPHAGTVDGEGYKVRHVVASKCADHRGLCKNDGAGN